MTGMAITDTATRMINFSVIAEPIANDSANTSPSRVIAGARLLITETAG
jgi:hypothetical protein